MHIGLLVFLRNEFMRSFLTVVIVFLMSIANAQKFSYPILSKTEKSFTEFIPNGWAIIDSAYGDLNRDGMQDAAIIIQYNDSVLFMNDGVDTVLTQPRVLLILFKNPANDSFRLIEQSNSFILSHDNPAMNDPFEDLTIMNGGLQIKFNLFYNAGSWWTTKTLYMFRYYQEEFVLASVKKFSLHRATQDFEEYIFHFSTMWKIFTVGNKEKDTRKISRRRFKLSSFQTLKSFVKPLTWEIEKGLFM